MRIRELRLQPFRNLQEFELPLASARIVIVATNGFGKSNILEAISYLSIGKSVRGAKDRDAVPHGGSFFDVEGHCWEGERARQLRIYYGGGNGKKAFCNQAALSRVSEVIGLFRTVHFSPEDVTLVLRFPAQRRRLLDILLSQSSGEYLQCLQRYNRTLAQRNELLRSAKRRGVSPNPADLEVWDQQFAEVGAGIRGQRLRSLAVLGESFRSYYAPFAPAGEAVSIEYRGPAAGDDAQLQQELLGGLREKAFQERMQGHTLSGPHRDDLVFLLNGREADSFASEGQMKTMLIAWKMAEVSFLEANSGQRPVFLLDDVISELDYRRSATLMEMIDEFGQVLVTAPKRLAEASGFETLELAEARA